MKIFRIIIAAVICLFCLNINAQQNNKARIHIIHADMSLYDDTYGDDADRLIGDVRMRHDSTYFFSDSAHFNDKAQLFKGYSRVHIEVNDSTDIFCDSCKYLGETRLAELFQHVILKDDSTVLKTNYMTYDRAKHLATYPNRGTIDRNDKHLKSRKGYYRDDIEQAYFRKDVVVTTPKYKMFTDSLVYDIPNEKMTFYGPTRIISDDYELVGKHGWYDGMNDVAYIDKDAVLTSEEHSISSDTMYYNISVDFAKAMGNVVMTDTTNNAMVFGDYAEMWKRLGKGFVTEKAQALYWEKNDTLFLHSDTLFFFMDTVTQKTEKILAYSNVRFFRKDLQGKCDTLRYTIADSTARMRGIPVIWSDNSQLKGDSINIIIANSEIDSVLLHPNGFIIQKDTIDGFNQIKGKQLTAYFKENELDHVYNEGNAETAYWLREEDGTLIGVNFSQSPSMDIKIEDNQIVRIKYFKKNTETLYPKEKMKPGQEILRGFEWLEEFRPKDRFDIFRIPEKKVETDDNQSHRRRKSGK